MRVQRDAGTTNAFTMTVMKLAADIEDPVERLDTIARSSAAAKQNLAGMSKGVLSNHAALFMGPFVAANRVGIAGRTTPPYNVVVSNVPGPTDPAYWAGARLDSMAPFAIPYHGVGLFVAALTVSEKFCVGSSATATASRTCNGSRSSWATNWPGSRPRSACGRRDS